MMTDISHPLTFSIITTTTRVGAECFFFFFSSFSPGRTESCPATITAIGGLSRSPTLIFIPVISFLKFFYFLWRLITAIVVLVADPGSIYSWEPALLSVWRLTHRHKEHDSICTLDLRPPDHNNISGQLSFSVQLV